MKEKPKSSICERMDRLMRLMDMDPARKAEYEQKIADLGLDMEATNRGYGYARRAMRHTSGGRTRP